jgi:hypothetical protein
MPRKCTVCTHPDREAIDKDLVSGEAFRGLAAKYRVSEDALMRHNAGHIAPALVLAQQAVAVAQADDLLSQVRDLQTKALSILATAEKAGDLRTALQAIAQARQNLELLARLLGELQQQAPTVNITLTPEWVQLRTTILLALEPYMDARLAVVEALNACTL